MRLSGPNLKKVAEILKKRFPNLTVEETIDLASAILESLQPDDRHD